LALEKEEIKLKEEKEFLLQQKNNIEEFEKKLISLKEFENNENKNLKDLEKKFLDYKNIKFDEKKFKEAEKKLEEISFETKKLRIIE
jgi:hypothetical protein